MTHRTAALVAPLVALLLSSAANASEIGTSAHKFGLGLALGAPTGISGKYYLAGDRAIEGVVAVYSNGWWGGGYYLHGTYLWHPDVLASEPGFELPWHGGVGGFLAEGFWGPWNGRYGYDGIALGVRGQIGLDFNLTDVRLQISGDIGLNLGINQYTGVYLAPGLYLTIRYFF